MARCLWPPGHWWRWVGLGLMMISLKTYACLPGTAVEVWSERDKNIIGIDALYRACETANVAMRYGVSYYADRRYLYEGIASSVRLFMNDVLSPYIGLGVLVGVGGRDVDVASDGLDNNGNGVVDESGEQERRLVASAFVYPEIGVAIYMNEVGVTVSAKRYFGSQFTGHVIYSLGLAYAFTSAW